MRELLPAQKQPIEQLVELPLRSRLRPSRHRGPSIAIPQLLLFSYIGSERRWLAMEAHPEFLHRLREHVPHVHLTHREATSSGRLMLVGLAAGVGGGLR